MGGSETKHILTHAKELIKVHTDGNAPAFKHILVLMPTLNKSIRDAAGNTIKKRDPRHRAIMQELAHNIAPVPCQIVIGPGKENIWHTKGELSFDTLAAETYEELAVENIPATSGIYSTIDKKNNSHFPRRIKPESLPEVTGSIHGNGD